MPGQVDRVVVLGFDAMDPVITRQLANRGELPAFRELLASSAQQPVVNPPGLYVGSLWTTFATGRSASETGFHCWAEIVPGKYEGRLTTPESIRGRPFWEVLSDAGKRVAVLDAPHFRAGTPINGVQVSEFGCHDRHFGLRTHPPELAQQIVERIGLHPVMTADPFIVREWAPDDYLFRAGPVRTPQEDGELLAAMLTGVDAKRRLSVEILRDGPWDLFLNVFGEPHGLGHQLWHVHDPSHPRHDPALRSSIGDPITQLYRKMDAALADHFEHVDEDTTLMVLLSHGMGPQYGATHLLPEILRRLDHSYRAQPQRSLEGRTLGRFWMALPAAVRGAAMPALAGLLRTRLRRRELRAPAEDDTEEQRRTQAFFLSPNNFAVGGVRINLEGREEQGMIRPGRQLDELCRRLEHDLLALVNVETGEPVITRVTRADELYERDSLDAMPDLFLDWNRNHLIEVVWSPRFGTIRCPYTHWRTGDHHPNGLLLVREPGARSGGEAQPIDIQQISAMITARLGVERDAREAPALPAPIGV